MATIVEPELYGMCEPNIKWTDIFRLMAVIIKVIKTSLGYHLITHETHNLSD